MSTALHRTRNGAVTPLPIVVADPPVNMGDEKEEFSWWNEGTMEWTEFDYLELPPHAAASVVGLEKAAIRKLEREFDVKLSDSQIADVLGFAKLVDAVRLGGDRRSKELCLAYLQKAHGAEGRDYRREAFEEPVLFKDFCAHRFMGLCAIGRLGIVYPKGADLPEVAIAVPNLIEGLKLQLILSLQQSRAAAHCERCGNSYIRHTQEQRFCSEGCASRERQARYRARKGAQS